MKGSHIAGLIVGLAVVGGGAFYGGTIYAKTTAQASRGTRGTFTGTPGQGFTGGGAGRGGSFAGGAAGGGFTTGQVITKDDKSVTVQTRDGSSKIVFLSASTTVGEMTTGSIGDVTNGANVMITGTTNSDGSITASSIQIRPDMPPGAPTNGTPTGGAPAPAPSNQ